ncbi:MAG: hypothetical protein ACFB13_17245 [Kiloniellaceae bacterium]
MDIEMSRQLSQGLTAPQGLTRDLRVEERPINPIPSPYLEILLKKGRIPPKTLARNSQATLSCSVTIYFLTTKLHHYNYWAIVSNFFFPSDMRSLLPVKETA